MAQPEQAAGEVGNPADPANPFEEIAADMVGEDAPEEELEQELPPAEEAEGDEPEASEEAEDDSDLEPEEDLPAIEAPVSWDADAKERFAKLDRADQEYISKRESERERFVQTKAQEAAQAKRDAQLEALNVAEQIKAQAAEQLQRYAKAFEVTPPNAVLMDPNSQYYNPTAYAQQLEHYQHSLAQRDQAQRDAESARAEQAQIQQARAEHEAEQFRQRLESELPEIFDPSTGQQLAQELNATAELLGFDPNHISDITAIKALKLTSEWKSKAEKYDGLMRKKMERVRAGKSPPPISKPGTGRTPDATRQAQADQAWQGALTAKTRNVREQHLAEWAVKTGWLD